MYCLCTTLQFKIYIHAFKLNKHLHKFISPTFTWARLIFGPKRDEVTGEWRKLHNEELKDLYSLPNIVRVVKSRRMRWAGHVARMRRIEVCTGCWWGSLREKGHWGDQDVCGRIILRWIFRKLEGVVGLDEVGSG